MQPDEIRKLVGVINEQIKNICANVNGEKEATVAKEAIELTLPSINLIILAEIAAQLSELNNHVVAIRKKEECR